MKIKEVFANFDEGKLSTLDLGVWCFLSWNSDRNGLYTKSRKETVSLLGISPRQLRSSIERLASAGILKSESKKGSKKTRWRVLTKVKRGEVIPLKQVGKQQRETGEKPAALSHLPF